MAVAFIKVSKAKGLSELMVKTPHFQCRGIVQTPVRELRHTRMLHDAAEELKQPKETSKAGRRERWHRDIIEKGNDKIVWQLGLSGVGEGP